LFKLGVLQKLNAAVREGIVAVFACLAVPEKGGLMFPHLKYRRERQRVFSDHIHYRNATPCAFPQPDHMELKNLA
jgi:tetraacyldisaccharide-1-P 4'-kinase